MSTRLLLLCTAITALACSGVRIDADAEIWEPLFNGRDLSGWEVKIAGYPLGENYNQTFVAEDSSIRVRYDNYDTFDGQFGHLFYTVPYSFYKIRFDYRFTGRQARGGPGWAERNSGIMLHAQAPGSMEIGQTFPVSIELQLLGGLGKGERPTGNVCTPGTTVTINDTVRYAHCINSSSGTYHVDDWVKVEAVVLGGEQMFFLIEHDTVLQLRSPAIGDGFTSGQRGEEDWVRNGVLNSQQQWLALEGSILEKGYLALQAESHPVDFRNIEILNLCGCTDPSAQNFKSYYVKSDSSSCIY